MLRIKVIEQKDATGKLKEIYEELVKKKENLQMFIKFKFCHLKAL